MWHFTRIDYISSPHFIFQHLLFDTLTWSHGLFSIRISSSVLRAPPETCRTTGEATRWVAPAHRSRRHSSVQWSHMLTLLIYTAEKAAVVEKAGVCEYYRRCVCLASLQLLLPLNISVQFFNLLCRMRCPIWTSTWGRHSPSLTVGWGTFGFPPSTFAKTFCVV